MSHSYTQRGSQTTQKNFGPDGEVLCNCHKPAVFLTARKEGPNFGRHFYKCDHADEAKKCNFFFWQDDAVSQIPPSGGQRLGGGSQAPPRTQSSNQTQRAPPSTPQRKPAPWKSSQSKKRTVDLTESDEDEIDESGLPTPIASPSKRNKAHTFSEPGKAKPSTPPHSEFAAIQVDPDSPFHRLQANLFSTPAALRTPSTSHGSPTTAGGTDLPSTIASAVDLMLQAQNAAVRTERQLVGERKGKEVVKTALDKAKGEIAALRERVRALEEENEELRNRSS